MMTDASKVNVWAATWLPFGGAYNITGTAANDNRFPGQWFQVETGLNYNWNRHYDPTRGRYTQADPLGLIDGPSIYAYALSNPQNNIDPTGEVAPAIAWAVATGARVAGPYVARAAGAAVGTLLGILLKSDKSDDAEDEAEKLMPSGVCPIPSPALDGDPYNPKEVDKRRSRRRKDMNTGNFDPDSDIPDQGPGRNLGGHQSNHRPHLPGQRNRGAGGQEHSIKPKGGLRRR